MEISELKRPKIDQLNYQCDLLNQLNQNQISIKLKHNESFPTIETLKNLMSFLDDAIEDSSITLSNKLLLIEIQFFLFSSVVGGMFPKDLFNLSIKTKAFETFIKDVSYLKNLVSKIKTYENIEYSIFSMINRNLIFESLNLFFILNGIESSVSENKLKILHGRYFYLLQGNDLQVRKELCHKFSVTGHLELLKKLKLVSGYKNIRD